jgi:hypothetical protein
VFEGNLMVPPDARGVVLVVDSSGASLHRPSNVSIAEVLRRAGLATIVLGLLTAEEARLVGASGTARFDVQLLAERVGAATDWLMRYPSTGGLRIGYLAEIARDWLLRYLSQAPVPGPVFTSEGSEACS